MIEVEGEQLEEMTHSLISKMDGREILPAFEIQFNLKQIFEFRRF